MCELCQNSSSIKVNAAYDPTRTTTLRNTFVKAMDKGFNKVIRAIHQKIVVEDFFELNTVQTNISKKAYTFPRAAEKLNEFMEWLKTQTDSGILRVMEFEQIGTAIEKAWTNLYIVDSYKRGVIRARYELLKIGYENVPSITATGGIEMSMMLPIHVNKLGLLYTRVYSDLKGITSAMDTQISRILAQGMAEGDGPALLSRKIISAINGSGMGDLGITDTLGRFISAKRRAQTLARTEIIRAHHQAMIQEYKNWALEGVVVMAEFLTVNDDRVCAKCESLTLQNPYTLDEAFGLIPVHPNCRCICLPFEEGVDTLITRKAV